MKKITVCILTSGTGSRLDHYTVNKNKSLLSIKKESILTKIFNNFRNISSFAWTSWIFYFVVKST